MLVVTLGTPASGSTWIFNVARAIVATCGTPAVSLSADDAVDLLDNIPLDARIVLLKAHSLDMRLLRLTALAGGRLIISTRDPRDSIVSQHERFSLPLQAAAGDITRSFASLAMLPRSIARLVLRYEDRFFERVDTIVAIARFLDIALSIGEALHIQAALRAEAVRETIAAHLASIAVDQPLMHDMATQWHPDHVGDGKIGKWKDKLAPETAVTVAQAIHPMATDDCWRCVPIRWSAELFSFDEENGDPATGHVRCNGEARVPVFGPYLHLPAGRWRATLFTVVPGDTSIPVTVDVHLPLNGRGTVVERTFRLDGTPVVMEFDHQDHFEPVEVRVLSIPGACGDFVFGAVEMTWLGPPMPVLLSAVQIGAAG